VASNGAQVIEMDRILEPTQLEQILRFAPPKGRTLPAYADHIRLLHHRFLQLSLGHPFEPNKAYLEEMRELAQEAHFLATQYTDVSIVDEDWVSQLGVSLSEVPPLQVSQDALALAGMLFEFLGDLVGYWREVYPNSPLPKRLETAESDHFMAGLCYRLGLYEPLTAVLMGRLAAKSREKIRKEMFSVNTIGTWATCLTCELLSGDWVQKEGRDDFEGWSEAKLSEIQTLKAHLRRTMPRGRVFSPRETLQADLSLNQIEAMLTQMKALYFGEGKLVNPACQFLTDAVESARKLGDYRVSWQLRSLRDIFRRQWQDSPWNRLRGILPDSEQTESYLASLIADGFVTFWTSQVQALKMRANLPDLKGGYLDERIKRVVVSLPTSAGKTLLAELAIVKTLLNEPSGWVVYVTPSRALCEQSTRKLAQRLEPIGMRVSTFVGDTEGVGYEELLLSKEPPERGMFQPINVLVITPEKLSSLFRRRVPLIDGCRLFVFDEIHTIGRTESNPKAKELGRGWTYEEIVTCLLKNESTRDTKMLFMSAMMPNRFAIRTWVDPEEIHEPIHIDWRPTRLLKGYIKCNKFNPLQSWPKPSDLPCAADFGLDLFYVAHRDELKSPYKLSNIISSRRWLKSKPQYKMDWDKSDGNIEHTVKAALKFARLGSVLIYVPWKSNVEKVAKQLALKADLHPEIQPKIATEQRQYDEMLDFLKERLPANHLLLKTVPAGIGFHHADLWLDVRAELEDAFERGWLQIMVATSTLVQGVNFPIRTLLIGDYRLGRGTLTKADVSNLAGRAGRARFETEGQVVMIQNRTQDEAKIREYLPLEPEDIQSSLADEEVLKVLEGMIEAIDEGVLTEEQLLFDAWGEYDKHREVAERLQTFAMLCSSHDWASEEDEDFIELLGTYSFAGSLSERAQETVGRFLHRNTQAFRLIPTGQIDLYAQTGLSVRSCQRLMEDVQTFWDKHRQEIDAMLTKEMVIEIAQAIYEIPETEPKLARNRLPQPAEVLADWMWEHDLDEIQRLYFSKIRTNRVGTFMQHIQEAIYYKAPWGLSAFWLLLRSVAKTETATDLFSTRLGKELALLPAYAKFGVKTPSAVILSALGLTPPSLTRELGDFWEREFSDSRFDFAGIMRWFEEPDFHTLAQEAKLSGWQIQRLMRFVEKQPGRDQLYRRDWTVECHIHGWQYYEGPHVLKELKTDQELTIEREQDNPSDSNAVVVKTLKGEKLGYIPWKYTRRFSQRLLRGDIFRVRIREINPFRPPSQCLRVEVWFKRRQV
jgi:helicase